MFKAYLITCVPSGRYYVGITSATLKRRWIEHLSYAKRGQRGALQAAIRKYGVNGFTVAPIGCARSWDDACALEATLIQQWGSLAPGGYNLTLGGEGRHGFKPTPESVERSAAKHRGKPCHPNTRRRSSEVHKGIPKSPGHRAKIAAAKLGRACSKETKAKMSAYWAERRARGDFKTTEPYANSRKAASATIAKIPFALAQHIARTFLPESAI